jgi:hypothetical protein
MDWMGLEKIVKKFELFGIQTHPIPLNPHGLRANRTSPKAAEYPKPILVYPEHRRVPREKERASAREIG